MKKYLFIFFSIVFFFTFSCSISPKRYRIGIDPSFYPFDFGKLNPNICGFIEDLLFEIAKIENIEFEKIEANWDNLLEGLDAKDKSFSYYDLCISLMQPYNFNLDKYCFSSIFFQTGPVLLVLKSNKDLSWKDLKEKRVGIVNKDLSIRILQKYPGVLLFFYSSTAEMLNQLEEKKIEAAAALRPFAIAYTKNIYQDKFSLSDPIEDEGIRFISLRKKNCNLMQKLNEAIKKLEKNKTLQILQKKWNLI